MHAQLRKYAVIERAEKERLVNLALRARKPSTPRHQIWLAKLGARLIAWGRQLQDRYADTLRVPRVAQR
jgi:hypothetical protein